MAGESWSKTTLGAIADAPYGLVDGPFGSNLPGSAYTQSGVPVVRGSNLSLGELRFKGHEFVYVSDEMANRLARSICRPGDIVFTKKGTIGQTGLIPNGGRFERYLLSSNQMKLSVDPKIADPAFVYYVVSSPKSREKIVRDASITGVPKTNVAYLSNFPIDLPSLNEQRAIAHILGTLDDKIELNRRMNETLEAMAQAIFKSWFVDFEPVRAKAKGRDPGLPKHIADLFPDHFEDSELGEIPAGWEVGTLADLTSLNPEAWSKETRPAIIHYVDLSNSKWGHIESVTAYAQQDAPSRAQRVLRPRDTIVGTVRPGNGSYAYISEEGLTGSTGFAILRPLRAEFGEFVYLAATAAENIEALSHLADGGAYPAVRPEVVAATQVIKAGDDVITGYSRLAGPLFAKVAENEREYRTLAALRDTLLPKLLSGELRVQGRVQQQVANP